METSQKVEKTTTARDAAQITDLVTSVGHLVAILNDSYHVMQSLANLVRDTRTIDLVSDGVVKVTLPSNQSDNREFVLCNNRKQKVENQNFDLWTMGDGCAGRPFKAQLKFLTSDLVLNRLLLG